MNTNTKKHSNIFNIIALLLFILAFAGAAFYVKPVWDDVTSLSKGRDEKVTEKAQLDQQLADLQKLQNELNLTSEVNKQGTLAAIPEKLEEDKLINDISGIARKNDMVLSGINFGVSSAAEGEVANVTINANLAGNESSLISFLKDVEGNSRKLVVKNISVQVGSNELGMSRVNFSVNMEAYYQGTI